MDLETLLLPGQTPRHIPYPHPAPIGRKGQILGIGIPQPLPSLLFALKFLPRMELWLEEEEE